jgi:hypothetical protein
MTGEPIRNAVTGAESRAQIVLPEGFEYEVADIGSASSRSQGPVQVGMKSSYGQFARLHLNNHGVVRGRAAARREPALRARRRWSGSFAATAR